MPAPKTDPFVSAFVDHVQRYCACTEQACVDEMNEAGSANPLFIKAHAANPLQIRKQYGENQWVMDALSRHEACMKRW